MGYDFQMIGYGSETSANYTHNVTPMFTAAIPDRGIMVTKGMTGNRAVQPLMYIRNYTVQHPEEMEALNPTNGWGDYSGVLRLLDRLIEISQDFPDGEWEVD